MTTISEKTQNLHTGETELWFGIQQTWIHYSIALWRATEFLNLRDDFLNCQKGGTNFLLGAGLRIKDENTQAVRAWPHSLYPVSLQEVFWG